MSGNPTPAHPSHLYECTLVIERTDEVGHQPVLMVHPLPQVQDPVTNHMQELKSNLNDE